MKLFALSFLIGCLVSLVHSEDVSLKPDNVDGLIKSGTWLILHYSPYCIHCRNFAPHWKKATEDLDHLAEESDFHFGSIDCSTQGDLCDAHGIMGYPTVQLWENGENVERYTAGNYYDPLVAYVKDKIAAASLHNDNGVEEDTEKEAQPDDETDNNEEEKAEEEEEEVEESDESNPEEIEEEMEAESENDVVEADILPNPDGVSVDLDSARLREIATNEVPWFIKFYAPWCPHCKALAPTWTEMASQLRGQVNVGEVNCQELPSLCEEFKIRGYPTLQMLGHGDPIDYHSDRSLISLMKFANEHAGLDEEIKELDANELSQYLTVKDVALIYLHNEKNGKVPELLEVVSNQFRSTIPFFSTQDEKVLEKYDISPSDLPAVLIAKDNSVRLYHGSHDLFRNTATNRDAFVNWIENEQYPLITKLGPSNQQSVLSDSHSVVVLNIVHAKDTVSQSKFRNIATVWHKSSPSDQIKVIFAEMDRAMWRNYVLDKFGVEHDETAKMVIYKPDAFEYYSEDVNGHELSLDKPEGLYISLKSLKDLKGHSTLAFHEKVGSTIAHTMNWIATHWLISIIGFGFALSFVYRYLTYRSPKRLGNHAGNSVLPSFRSVNSYDYAHKD
ncbi:MAG: thioredoxin-like protein [Benjaminiella poitrasii]|nr:MAG: thioredoxin-like protein [Benjaminiella poitrasii]